MRGREPSGTMDLFGLPGLMKYRQGSVEA